MTRLRPWHPDDAGDVLAAFAASPDLERQAPAMATIDDARAYVEHLMAGEAWCIEVDDRASGNVMASDLDERHGTAWMSYWLAPWARGHGHAARALAALSTRMIERGVERLELGARAENPASIAVAERAGYLREGVERSRLRYDGVRYDVVRLARLATDVAPQLQVHQ